jgi:hypothetical protein
VSITLNKWKEVKFSLTDKDLSLTLPRSSPTTSAPPRWRSPTRSTRTSRAVQGHPLVSAQTATPALADIAAIRKIMFDNKVPLNDNTKLHYMIDGTTELAYLNALAAPVSRRHAGSGAPRRLDGPPLRLRHLGQPEHPVSTPRAWPRMRPAPWTA